MLDYPSFPSAQQIGNYLEAYADKFELIKHIELSTAVTSIRRDEEDGVWVVSTKHTKTGDEEEREYDRVVLATGGLNVVNMPEIKGIEKFAGDAIHSRDFKDPTRYAGKNVLVVGLGSTGADTLSFLEKAGANKLYLSSRSRCSLVGDLEISAGKDKESLTSDARCPIYRSPERSEDDRGTIT